MTRTRNVQSSALPRQAARASIAGCWHGTVTAVIDVDDRGAGLGEELARLLDDLLDAPTAESAHSVGVRLSDLCGGRPPALAVSLDLLGKHLPGLPGTRVDTISLSPSAVLASLAAGYLDGARTVILEEQHAAHRATLEVMWGAQQALFHSEKRFRAVFDATVVGMVLCDLRGRITSVNPAMLAMIDRPMDRILGRRPDHLITPIDPDDRRHLRAFLGLASGERDEDAFEGEYRFSDGRARFLAVMMSLVRDDQGAPDYVLVMAQDLSDRRASELASRRSRERFHQLIQNSSDMIAVITPGATIEYVSPSVERILGHHPDALLGTSFADLVMGDGQGAFRTMMDELRATPRGSRSLQLRVLHRDNSWRWLEMAGTNLVDVWSLDGIVINARDITERKTFELQLERQAYYDAMTALPNRLHFRTRLEAELKRGAPVGVLFMDLDRFKVINDSLGHGVGDQLLVAVGQRILDSLRDGEVVARFGGDEFAVLVPGATVDSAKRTAQRIRHALRRPVPLQHRQTTVETSMGIALSDASLSTTSGLLRAADVALYRAKAMGRGIEVLYEPEMLEESIRRFDLEADLQHALAEDQFTVFYQPVVQLAANRTIAVESSLRWNRPGHGMLEPAGFRDVAEEIGLLAELEAWMLTQAIRQLAEWRSTGLVSLDEFQLQVGLTRRPRDLATLVHLAERLTREWNIDPRHVCFDLHPRVEWSSDAEREAFFAEVRRIGIGVAVTVYADGNDPLFYLRRQYADILRIDPAFLAEHGELETDGEIVAAIAGLARRLGAKSMALGIDSSHRHLVAREIGVPYGQGDYFGAAEPAAAMTARLARSQPPDGGVRM